MTCLYSRSFNLWLLDWEITKTCAFFYLTVNWPLVVLVVLPPVIWDISENWGFWYGVKWKKLLHHHSSHRFSFFHCKSEKSKFRNRHMGMALSHIWQFLCVLLKTLMLHFHLSHQPWCSVGNEIWPLALFVNK